MMRRLVPVLSVLLVVGAVGCKSSSSNRAGHRTVKASIATFDENADVELDFNGGGGSERVDEWALQEAFNQSFGGMDECVASTKAKLGMKADSQLDGGIEISVKLNPQASRPLGVNATLTSGKWDKQQDLKDCIRDAVASVEYPTYDGPPQIATFSVDELDPGYAEE